VLTPDEKLVRPGSNRNLKQTFSSLIEVMRDAQRMGEMEEKIREVEQTSKRRLSALEKLQQEITGVVLSLRDTVGKELSQACLLWPLI
jgi:hypothetical protein